MNLYIRAMEIGIAHEKVGISYCHLIEILDLEYGYKMNPERNYVFLQWFVESFKCHDSNRANIASEILVYTKRKSLPLRNDVSEVSDDYDLVYDNWLQNKFYLSGQASKQYLDYLELQEAKRTAQDSRISSNKALRVAQWSLIAATIVAVLPFAYSIYQDENIRENPLYNNNYVDIPLEEGTLYEPEFLEVSNGLKLEDFVQLSQLKQYEIVFNEGTCVDYIREEDKILALYSVGSFWVEITCDSIDSKVLRFKPFKNDKFTID